MQLFYVPDIEGNEIFLNETESKHAVKVLRLVAGSKVQVVDGKGGLYTAEISEPHPKKCILSVLKTNHSFGKKNFWLHLAVAPTKNTDRFEWFIEKATEIGVSEITPIICEHSERKKVKSERLEKIVISAMKQSVKAYLPKLNQQTPFEKIIQNNQSSQKFIAHCGEGEKVHLKDVVEKGGEVLVLIGPEGDFSANEVEQAKSMGFTEISLGSSRLRTETAGVAACHIVNLVNE